MQARSFVEVGLPPQGRQQRSVTLAAVKFQSHSGHGGLVKVSQREIPQANEGQQGCHSPNCQKLAPGKRGCHGVGAYRCSTARTNLSMVLE